MVELLGYAVLRNKRPGKLQQLHGGERYAGNMTRGVVGYGLEFV